MRYLKMGERLSNQWEQGITGFPFPQEPSVESFEGNQTFANKYAKFASGIPAEEQFPFASLAITWTAK